MGPELLHANVVNYNENKFQWAFFSVGLSMGDSLEFTVGPLIEPERTLEVESPLKQIEIWILPDLDPKRWIQIESLFA